MPRSRLAQVLGAAVAVVVLASLWFIAPVLWVELDEPGVPSRPNAQTVPAGIEVVREATECGSGGCWRELTLSWPGHSRGDVLEAVGLTGNAANDLCRPVSWLDRRVVCVGEIPDRPATRTDEALIQVRWQRPLGL